MIRRSIFVLLIGIVTVAATFAEEPVHGDGAALKIAYNVLYDRKADNYEIFIMNSDGSGKKNISNWKGVDWVYCADGNKLYFVSDRDTTHRAFFLYEMDADGGNIKKISPFRVHDSWVGSRNNRSEFVVAKYMNKKKAIVLIDRNGKEMKTLLQSDSSY